MRSARSAELTDAGHRLAGHAGRILAEIDAAEADLAAHNDTPSGRVVISAFATAAVALAPTMASRLRRYPDLNVIMRQAPPARNLDRLRAGETDIALVDDWTGEWTRHPGTLRFVELCRDPTVLIIPPDHSLAATKHPALADLVHQPWITAPPDEPSRQALDAVLAKAGSGRSTPWEFQGLDTIVNLVARGLGIAMVPRMAVDPRRRDLITRPVPEPASTRTIYAITRPAIADRPSVAAVLAAPHAAADDHRRHWDD